jgi:hypothetical protein
LAGLLVTGAPPVVTTTWNQLDVLETSYELAAPNFATAGQFHFQPGVQASSFPLLRQYLDTVDAFNRKTIEGFAGDTETSAFLQSALRNAETRIELTAPNDKQARRIIRLFQQAANVDTKKEAKALNEESIRLLAEMGGLAPEEENTLLSWGNYYMDRLDEVERKVYGTLWGVMVFGFILTRQGYRLLDRYF